MRIAICDDEKQILRDIAEKIEKLLPGSSVKTYTDGKRLLEDLTSDSCDLLLLDIDMPELCGLDIAEQLCSRRIKPLLVFVTSHDELVYDSLRYHPFGFIRKHHFNEEIERLLHDCEQELNAAERHFSFKAGTETVKLGLSEILYFESDGNYLKLVTADREYRIRDTVISVENALSGQGFIRLHRGFLVNQKAVRILGAEEAELVTGVRLPIGRNYAEAARKELMRYMRK